LGNKIYGRKHPSTRADTHDVLSDRSTFTLTGALSDRSTFTSTDARATDLRHCFFAGLVVVYVCVCFARAQALPPPPIFSSGTDNNFCSFPFEAFDEIPKEYAKDLSGPMGAFVGLSWGFLGEQDLRAHYDGSIRLASQPRFCRSGHLVLK
jgi:hypothetical protein